MEINMFVIKALVAIASMLIVGILGIAWYTTTDEYQEKSKEDVDKFWFG